MTPEQEDVLVERVRHIGITEGGDPVRLAIRAAYAQGREDAAKVCEERANRSEVVAYRNSAIDCAAAIRRGE